MHDWPRIETGLLRCTKVGARYQDQSPNHQGCGNSFTISWPVWLQMINLDDDDDEAVDRT